MSMKFQHYVAVPLLMALISCGPQRQPQVPANNSESPTIPAASAPPAVSNSETLPAATAQPAVDPKSTDAARALVATLADLLNQRKFDQAYMLLGPNAPPRTDFDRHFSSFSELKVSVGKSGDQEGAAGSIYLSVPVTIAGVSNGQRVNRSATVMLRRANDIPGSTEAQRRWHIERIDWEDAADGG
jgi:hypothetical protein